MILYHEIEVYYLMFPNPKCVMSQIGQAHIQKHCTKKMKFSIKDFFSKRDQIRGFLRIWLHLSSINVTKSAGNCGFDHVYLWKT